MDFFDLLEILLALLFVFGPALVRLLRLAQARRQQQGQQPEAAPTTSEDLYEEAYADYEAELEEEEALEEEPWAAPPAAPPPPSWRYDLREEATLAEEEGGEEVSEEESYEQVVEEESPWLAAPAPVEERPFVSYEEEAFGGREVEPSAAARARALRRTLEQLGVRPRPAAEHGLGPTELRTAGFVRDAVILQVLLERPAPLGQGPLLRNTRGRSL